MNARLDRIAYEAMMMPSISECGSAIINGASRQVPGSPSSALTANIRGFGSWRTIVHLRPVGNPAPPRPRRSASLTCALMSSRVRAPDKHALSSAYPPCAT
jgi:hypothetical protein